MDTTANIIDYVISELSPKRLTHTFSVADECRMLAGIYGISEEKKDELYTAALLHDITKEKPLEFHLELLKKHGVDLPEDELDSIPALHARTGAIMARELFGVSDAVFSAIDAHTTGKENMSFCDKILFLCDYIEPKRTHGACISLRKYFYDVIGRMPPKEALDRAVLRSMDGTLTHLIGENRLIALRTVKARNHILKIIDGKEKSGK